MLSTLLNAVGGSKHTPQPLENQVAWFLFVYMQTLCDREKLASCFHPVALEGTPYTVRLDPFGMEGFSVIFLKDQQRLGYVNLYPTYSGDIVHIKSFDPTFSLAALEEIMPALKAIWKNQNHPMSSVALHGGVFQEKDFQQKMPDLIP